MKCIQCDVDNNLKDRVANRGLCRNCEHPFAFEPGLMKEVKITDSLFAKAIADISLNNTFFFTPKQFLYFLRKRSKGVADESAHTIIYYIIFGLAGLISSDKYFDAGIKPIFVSFFIVAFNLVYTLILLYSEDIPFSRRNSNANSLQIIGAVNIVLGSSYSLVVKSEIYFALAIIFGSPILILGYIQKKRLVNLASLLISNLQVQEWTSKWVDTNGQIDRLLPAPITSIESSIESNVQNSDVTDYSFDRLVVCNSPEIAQMLIANNFHFENNCAILSIDGYPAAVFDTVLQMLRRNPDLMVYAFHDASPDGVSLVHQLRTNPTWFVESTVTIVDLGLLPRQVLANSRNLFIHRTATSATTATELAPAIRQNFTDEELAWLDAGNYVELESFTPQRLIQILSRGIASSQELATSDWMDSNAGNRVLYAIESFG
jgi:hypothetical protein